MNPRIKRITGLVLVVIACLWLGLAQVLIWTTPVAAASEAPDRHYPEQETFTKQEAYDLSFALARDVSNRSPNVLLPSALLLFASWLFHTSRAHRAPTRSNDNTGNA
jgi:hypothetical protein